MQRSLTRMVCGLAILAASILAHAPAASAAGQQYVWWCWSASLIPSKPKVFYSAIFASDANGVDIKVAYGKYVRENYFDDSPGPGECIWSMNKDQARGKLDTDKANSRYNHSAIVDTGWTYSQ